MPRRPLLIASLVLLAGCSSQSTNPSQSTAPSPVELTACQKLINDLPDNLDGDALVERTDTTATWGLPAMTLTCGVESPAGYKRSSEVYVINDISWYGEKTEGGYTFYSVGREPMVQMNIPDTHDPEVNPLVDLAPIMATYTEVTDQVGENG